MMSFHTTRMFYQALETRDQSSLKFNEQRENERSKWNKSEQYFFQGLFLPLSQRGEGAPSEAAEPEPEGLEGRRANEINCFDSNCVQF